MFQMQIKYESASRWIVLIIC